MVIISECFSEIDWHRYDGINNNNMFSYFDCFIIECGFHKKKVASLVNNHSVSYGNAFLAFFVS